MARAGKLREKAVFSRLTDGAVDEYGNPFSGWQVIGSRMADVIERLGKEQIEGGALTGVTQGTLRMRLDSFTGALTTADSVAVRGANWAIRGISHVDAKGVLIELTIERGVAL